MLTSSKREDRLAADKLWWAWEVVEERMNADTPAEAVGLLVALADAAPDDPALAYLGAGPVEDLLCGRAVEAVDDVDNAARTNEAFRTALRCAWHDEHVPAEIAERLRRFGEPL
jgi:hypothetical protein